LARYGLCMYQETADYGGAQEAFQRAFAIAQRERSVPLELWTRVFSAEVDGWHLNWRRCLDQATRAVEVASATGDVHAKMVALLWASEGLMTTGDAQRGQRFADEMLAIAQELRDQVWLALALWVNERLAQLLGDLKRAHELSSRGLPLWPQDPRPLCSRVMLDYQLGDLDDGRAQLEQLLSAVSITYPGPPMQFTAKAAMIPMAAYISGVKNYFDDAESAAQTVLTQPHTPLSLRLAANVGKALIAIMQEEPSEARRQYDHLEPTRGTMLVLGMISSDRLLGLLAATTGLFDQSVIHFEEGYAFTQKAGYSPELAWTCFDHSRVLRKRGMPGDGRKARALLEEALSISRTHGMRTLEERASGLW